MIVVFIPALILEIFTANFLLKIILFHLPVTFWSIIEFTYWNLMLIAPKVFAIYISIATVNKAKELARHVRKYSNFCVNAESQQQVKE
jgi:hypothetical protein